MSNTWLIIGLVVLAAAGAVLVLNRKRQTGKKPMHLTPGPSPWGEG